MSGCCYATFRRLPPLRVRVTVLVVVVSRKVNFSRSTISLAFSCLLFHFIADQISQ